jgi:hypothetical protein
MNEPEVGKTYYYLTYADPGFTMPGLDPVVYVGKNIVGDEQEDSYYFQDTPSFTRFGLVTESSNPLECLVQAISTNKFGSSVIEHHQLLGIVNGAIERAEKLGFPKLKVCKGNWEKCT